MTLKLRYQTFKNKLKHTGINSDIINKRSMGNLAYTVLRLHVLFGKERALLWRYGRFQWCALGLNSRYLVIIKIIIIIIIIIIKYLYSAQSTICPWAWAFLFCWISFSFSRFRSMFGVSLQTDHPTLGLTWNTNYGNVKTYIHLWMKKT